MNSVYFDSAATSVPFESAISAANDAFLELGNPSSVHSAGINAKKIIDNSRKSLSASLFCKPEEIIFTSGGSESNNQAIFGLAKLRNRRCKRIITSDSEHPSAEKPAEALKSDGWEVIKIPTLNGVFDIEAFENALKDGAGFVSVMLANNETGAKYDISAIRKAIDKSGCGALLHCDAVQGFLKTEDRREIVKNCDTASISAHKIGGIKGVGALFVKKGINLPPFILGGGQESGLRSGTENVAGIAAFGAACGSFTPSVLAHITELYGYTVSLLSDNEFIKLNIPKQHINTIISASVSGVRSEVMLNALNAYGICVSAGSACSARKGNSTTLAAYGLPKNEIESTVRISIGAHNNKEECGFLAEKLLETAKRLRR